MRGDETYEGGPIDASERDGVDGRNEAMKAIQLI